MSYYLNVASSCQALGGLPHSGGVLDQDFRLVLALRMITEAQHERQELDSKKRQATRGTKH